MKKQYPKISIRIEEELRLRLEAIQGEYKLNKISETITRAIEFGVDHPYLVYGDRRRGIPTVDTIEQVLKILNGQMPKIKEENPKGGEANAKRTKPDLR